MSLFFGTESSEILQEEYREYLMESQVFPKLLEIFDKLHMAKVKPRKPLDFIRKELGSKPIPVDTLLGLEYGLNDARDEIKRLQRILTNLGVDYEKDNSELLNLSDVKEIDESG